VLIGCGSFDSLDDLPMVSGNLSVLHDLVSGDMWGLTDEHCTQVLNPPSPGAVSRAVRAAAEVATDTLLVYYAGHGLINSAGLLHLAVPDSEPRSVHDTAVPYEWIRLAVKNSPALRKIVILDCCYSARAFGLQSSNALALAEVDGTYVLTASAETAAALAAPGEPHTAFTGALVMLLRGGVAGAPELLDLDTIFVNLQSVLKGQGRPEPQCLDRNLLGRTAFARNLAFNPALTLEGYETEASQGTALAALHSAKSLSGAMQAVAEGVISGLGFGVAAIHLVRPDGDLVIAAVWADEGLEVPELGDVSPRDLWDQELARGQRWGNLRFVPDDTDEAAGVSKVLAGTPSRWLVDDKLYAPMYESSAHGDVLLGVIAVDCPADGLRPAASRCEALQTYAIQASLAIVNTRMRSEMQRALARLERVQSVLRASEESFRQAFEYAPSGIAISAVGGSRSGTILRANDALCKMLGRSRSTLTRMSFSDFVHSDDAAALVHSSETGGRAEVRLVRRDGTSLWVSLRNSIVTDADDDSRYLHSHVEDIEERKSRELHLRHQATHDDLTGLANKREFLARLSDRLSGQAHLGDGDLQGAARQDEFRQTALSPLITGEATTGPGQERSEGLVVMLCALHGFSHINMHQGFGRSGGDAVLYEVARRLQASVRIGDTVARLDGDEFVLLAHGLDPDGAADLAARARDAIISPIRVNGRLVRVGVYITKHRVEFGKTAVEILDSLYRSMYALKREDRQPRE
jgi:PAS domain S-box-containing protein/diguanylate cyclase (GGDEF)-like protein